MSGIEFLEEAMDIYPLARRVLLTAYADTHAAIDAINVVDLDHYLLKPWDPPEEKLYPVIDGLLEAWHATGDRAIPHTKVIGHRWNERSWEVRQFLARNQHSFRSFMADEPKGKQLLDAAGLDGYQLPVVITEQGETLVEPTNAELAAMLGLSDEPVDGDVRPRGHRRRTRRPRGRGVRRVRGPEDRADRGDHDGRPGRSQLEDRELPRLSHRRLGRRADHVGTPAGRALRRRGHHHPQGGQAAGRGQRHRAHDRIRGRQQRRRPGRHPRHRRRVPPAAGHRVLGRPGQPRVQLRGSRRLLRRVRLRRLGVQGRGRLHRGRRELGGAGSDVHVAHGEIGDAARARPVAGGVDVVLPDPADREERQHHRPHLHRSGRHARRGRPPHRPRVARQAERREGDRGRATGCAASSAPSRAPSGWT